MVLLSGCVIDLEEPFLNKKSSLSFQTIKPGKYLAFYLNDKGLWKRENSLNVRIDNFDRIFFGKYSYASQEKVRGRGFLGGCFQGGTASRSYKGYTLKSCRLKVI